MLTPVSQRAQAPARSLADIPKLCDPYTPLLPTQDDALLADLTQMRGGDRLRRVLRNIRRSGGVNTLHLLTGHLGSGKTTELLRLAHRLRSPTPEKPELYVAFIDADQVFDRTDVTLEDVLVGIWHRVLEDAPAAAIKVLTGIWKARIRKALLQSIVDLPDEAAQAAGTLIREIRTAAPDRRIRLRAALGPQVNSLISGLNDAFDALRQSAESMEIAIVIDNLEKLNPPDPKTIDHLYLERMPLLKDLEAHLVLTVPIQLCYSAAGASLIGLYGGEVVVLPMIQVRTREGEEDARGVAAFANLLALRVGFEELFEQGLEAARMIAVASGGCLRHGLRMVTIAANECDAPPVPAVAVSQAEATLIADFERALPESWLPTLGQVARKKLFPADADEAVKREMLRHLFVLEYQNGAPDPWYDVHPLVRRTRKFRELGAT